MKSCELESKLSCIHLEGVCPFRQCPFACEDYRHYLRDLKPLTSLEIARDYEELYGNKYPDGVNK